MYRQGEATVEGHFAPRMLGARSSRDLTSLMPGRVGGPAEPGQGKQEARTQEGKTRGKEFAEAWD